MTQDMHCISINAARYAVTLAALVEPDKYQSVMDGCNFEKLAIKLGCEADRLNIEAKTNGISFWPIAWVETVATRFNDMPQDMRKDVGEEHPFAVQLLIKAGNDEISLIRG
jgi:hypothetical protein